jgi:surface polysaccharide O-acyltransferase-like enzyme
MQKIKNYTIAADLIRILATFFVVFSHTTDVFVLWTTLKGSISWEIVYYFNTLSRVAVPVFVILSGYLILRKDKTTSIKEFYKRRFTKIAIPFLIWLIIYYWWDAYWGNTLITPQRVIETLWTANIRHLYFLIIILELYIIAPFFVHFLETKKRNQQTILFWVLIGLSIFCAILANIPKFHFDLAKNFFTICIPYLGYFYAGAYLRAIRISKMYTVLLAALYFALAAVTNTIANGNMSTFIVFNYSPTLLPMSICFFLALKNCDQFFGKKLLSKSIIKTVSFIATTTFGIYLIHIIILDLVRHYFQLSPWQIHAPLVFFACLPAFLTFLIAFIIISCARRIPYVKYILG